METGLVSVIIPAYNQGHYLSKAIQSVLNQTYQNLEIIVVDDGSTDDTALVAHSFQNPQIIYIFQDNSGLSSARNTGIRNAHGEFISYLDSDDLFLPDKLQILVDVFQQDPEVGFCAGQAIPINENEQPIGKIFDKSIPHLTEHLVFGNPLHVGSVLLRTSWQERVGEFDETLRSYEDWEMWLRLARAGCKMTYVPQPVSLYRFHTAQMTRIGHQMTNATFSVLDKVFNDANLPPNWLELKDKAYSNANLRAMAQSYLAEDYLQAKQYMCKAVELNPELIINNGDLLVNRLSALANSPKNPDPVSFLEKIYTHLPDEFAELGLHKTNELSKMSIELAFEAYSQKDYSKTRTYVQRALQYQPSWSKNPGVISILLKSYARPVFDFIFTS